MKYGVDVQLPAISTLSRWLGPEEPVGNGKLPPARIPSPKEKP